MYLLDHSTEFWKCGVMFIFFYMSICVYACMCMCSHELQKIFRRATHGAWDSFRKVLDTLRSPHEEVISVHCRVCSGFVTAAFIQLLTFLKLKTSQGYVCA